VSGESWVSTTLVRAEVALLASADRPLDPRTRVRFHLGTADVGARVVAAKGLIAPGSRTPVRVILETPVIARAGDRFVLRTPSPATTIGGGIVEDPLPPHRRGRGEGLPESVGVHLERLLAEASTLGIAEAALPVRLGVSPAAVGALVGASPAATLRIGGRVYAPSAALGVKERLRALVEAQHQIHPLEPGVSLQSARAKLAAPAELIESVLAETLAAGELSLEAGMLRRSGWSPTLTAAESALSDRLAAKLVEAGREPPSVGELTAAHGSVVPSLLRLLERAGIVVAVEPDRYYDGAVIEQLIERLRSEMVPGREYGPAELREILGVSRKYLIPLLEYCDRVRVTDRQPGGRMIVGTQFASRSGDKRS
jgi:selenocysteine-specific elongation factor